MALLGSGPWRVTRSGANATLGGVASAVSGGSEGAGAAEATGFGAGAVPGAGPPKAANAAGADASTTASGPGAATDAGAAPGASAAAASADSFCIPASSAALLDITTCRFRWRARHPRTLRVALFGSEHDGVLASARATVAAPGSEHPPQQRVLPLASAWRTPSGASSRQISSRVAVALQRSSPIDPGTGAGGCGPLRRPKPVAARRPPPVRARPPAGALARGTGPLAPLAAPFEAVSVPYSPAIGTQPPPRRPPACCHRSCGEVQCPLSGRSAAW